MDFVRVGDRKWVRLANRRLVVPEAGAGGVLRDRPFLAERHKALQVFDGSAVLAFGLGPIEMASRSSILTMAKASPEKECLRAFCAERALPEAVRGPVEFWALARLAASC